MMRRGLVVHETPSGTMNGSNTAFTLAKSPRGLIVALNGIVQKQADDFTISGRTITMTTAPESTDWMRAIYEPLKRPERPRRIEYQMPVASLGI